MAGSQPSPMFSVSEQATPMTGDVVAFGPALRSGRKRSLAVGGTVILAENDSNDSSGSKITV
jgi:hypothetical protein